MLATMLALKIGEEILEIEITEEMRFSILETDDEPPVNVLARILNVMPEDLILIEAEEDQ
jgi:hypothetical protein